MFAITCRPDTHAHVLLSCQHPSGAIVAAPDFPPYRYCWLRDGTFVALAMSVLGYHEEACAFYRFIARAVSAYRHKAEAVSRFQAGGGCPGHDAMLHTRFTVTGQEATEPWGNFQLDGYGTWLWAVSRAWSHDPPQEIVDAGRLTVRYLAATWSLPCFDPWEEHPGRVHTATLGAVAAGMTGAAGCDWLSEHDRELAAATAEAAVGLIRHGGLRDGVLGKWIADDPDWPVDSAVLWCLVPFGIFPPDSHVGRATVRRIERDLLGGGLKRYLADTYYGGGEWIPNTGFLAWTKEAMGDRAGARDLREWIDGTAEQGMLPEQVPRNLTAPGLYQEWVGRWGPIAMPLMWSHAMRVLAAPELCRGREPADRF